MTRRARMGPLQTLGRGVDRMAPGGRRSAAESPIRPFYRPVGEAGAEPTSSSSETCVDLFPDPDGYTYRPTSGTFGAPVGAWYGMSLVLTAASDMELVYDFGVGAAAPSRRLVKVGGPWPAGATVDFAGIHETGPGNIFDWVRLSTRFASSFPLVWVAATGVQFCYTTTPPTAAATVRDVEI